MLVFAAVAALVLIVLNGLTRRRGGRTPVGYPYGPQRALITAAHRSILGVLEQVVGETRRIFGKVRLAEVIKVNAGLTRSARQVALNRISGKHLGFVLCDPTDLTAVAAIGLDDKSHEASNCNQRDSFVDTALGAAGVPVHHFAAERSHSERDRR